jgi:NAD(P)-dependent dehydrogenase (short-subunit alcohol dehydrogenase family)
MIIDQCKAILPYIQPAGGRCMGGITFALTRYVTPEEIANTVLFLCSDLASGSPGRNTLSTDGARTAVGGAVTQAM